MRKYGMSFVDVARYDPKQLLREFRPIFFSLKVQLFQNHVNPYITVVKVLFRHASQRSQLIVRLRSDPVVCK